MDIIEMLKAQGDIVVCIKIYFFDKNYKHKKEATKKKKFNS